MSKAFVCMYTETVLSALGVVGGFGGSLLQQDSTAGAIGMNKLQIV